MMRQLPLFPITADQIANSRVFLTGEEHTMLVQFLGGKTGDPVNCKIPNNKTYRCLIEHIEKRQTILRITAESSTARVSRTIGCFLGIPKQKVMDSIAAKATELGLSFIQPVLTAFSEHKTAAAFDRERFIKISRQSMQECKRSDEMKIFAPIRFTQFEKTVEKKTPPKCVKIFPFEREQKKELQPAKFRKKNILFFIGPEKGFADAEADQIQKLGFTPVILSDTILKVDTALILTLAKLL